MELTTGSVLRTNDRVIYEYVEAHLRYLGNKLDAERVDFNYSITPERPKFEVYIKLHDQREYQLQAETLKELMHKLYGENKVPDL